MVFESVGSSAAGDPANGRRKNGKGEQFSKMPIDSVLSLDGLSDRAKLVYAAIRKWDWGQGCFAGHKNIAEVLRRSESTVKRGVKELKDSGLVTLKYEGRGLNAAIYVLQDQDRSDVTHLDSSDVTSLDRSDLTYPYNITDDLEIDDLETDDTPHACGDAGGDNDFSKTKRQIVIQFYRKLDLPELSKSYIKLGIRLINRLQRQGYSLEQKDYAAGWTLGHCLPKHFGLVAYTIGEALAERHRNIEQERIRQDQILREEERKIAQDAKLREEAQERNRIIDRSPYKKEWDRYRELIRAEIKHQSYMTWFTGLYIDEISDGQVTLNVPNRFMADFIRENYDKLLRDIFQRDVKVKITKEEEAEDGIDPFFLTRY